mmetsp:Transcript_54068/g.101451  ORF Transcript_54068/g.101451 Transcript_54068/m.101451 type:complete len:88 (+) Transcript_54068:542-805(+)
MLGFFGLRSTFLLHGPFTDAFMATWTILPASSPLSKVGDWGPVKAKLFVRATQAQTAKAAAGSIRWLLALIMAAVAKLTSGAGNRGA